MIRRMSSLLGVCLLGVTAAQAGQGKGVAGQGDQFVRLQVMLPELVDEDLRKFVKKWPKRDYTPPRPNG